MTDTKISLITGSDSFEVVIPGEGWMPIEHEDTLPYIVEFEDNKENN